MQVDYSLVSARSVSLPERAHALLELMRPANLFTAAADSVAGSAVAGSAPLPGLVLSSMALYGGGVVFNDIFDRRLDAAERPERPLPSGRVSLSTSILFGGLLWAGGIAAGWSISPVSGMLALLVAATALIYDVWAKHSSLFGPVFMGLCRALNLLLGLSAVPETIPQRWLVASIPFAFVAGITLISAGEVHGSTAGRLISGAIAMSAAILGVAVVAIWNGREAIWTVPVFLLLVWRVGPPLWRALLARTPGVIRTAVVAGVLSLIVLDAGLSTGSGRAVGGLLLLALLPISAWVARRFAVS